MSLANNILSMDDRKSKELDIPEWKGKFIVKEISAKTREFYEIAYQKDPIKAGEGLKAKVVIECLFDMDGNKVFTKKDEAKLGEKSGSIIGDIVELAQQLSGVLEEEEKNS